MKNKHFCCCWDLEGPISITDFAAELSKKLTHALELDPRKYNIRDFFTMISNYDDYIIDVPGVKEELNIPEYQPGDTLRLMAPLYIMCLKEKDLISLARANIGLLPGCKKLIKILHKDWDIFIISTSYSQFAYNVASTLNIPKENVYCTELKFKKLKEELADISESLDRLIHLIFKKYLKNNKDLHSVIGDLNTFFWSRDEPEYKKTMNYIKVRGGKRKEFAVEEISTRTGIPIPEMIILGDSITDINMLERLKQEGGISISFNGNKFSVKHANIAVTTTNSLGVLPIFQEKHNLKNFLQAWEKSFKNFQNNPKKIENSLLTQECKKFFIKYNFLPEINDLTNKSTEQLKEIILKQERTRKMVRGWAGKFY